MELIEPWLKKASDRSEKKEFSIGSSSEMDPYDTPGLHYCIVSSASRFCGGSKLIKNVRSRTSVKTDFFSAYHSHCQAVFCRALKISRPLSFGKSNVFLCFGKYYHIRQRCTRSNDKRAVEHFTESLPQADIKIPDSVHNERYIHALEPRSPVPFSGGKKYFGKRQFLSK